MLKPTESQTKAVAFCCARCGAQIAVDLGELDPALRETVLRLARFVVCDGCKAPRYPSGILQVSPKHPSAIHPGIAQPSQQREIKTPYRDD